MAQRHPDRMPDLSYRFMARWFRIVDRFSPKKDRLAGFGICKGDTVVDYGCGPDLPGKISVPEAGRIYNRIKAASKG